ncbi:MAG: MiaB/RimO family radical SAM methylthiotransferase [Candidatus Omnitrophica bacterium]|nr:MiaB/RimO family radical SAM methylthiotransferase [Candidatus Omnitrophota bacterium]MDD5771739.1 MiaB/RimO family radical SAM methylthiotransferase [Candidatus Omnitrophota bacterium]
MRRIKFFTLGCKANQYDTQSIRERFLSRGFTESVGRSPAEYYLVNTCTVTSGADQKSRNIIRRCIQANPKGLVIVTGCMAENDWRSLSGIRGIGMVVRKCFFPEGISGFKGRTRAFLKIQDGCDNFCSYCKVALVRGGRRSKDIVQTIEEAKKLVAGGFKEIVLTGICLGAYGKDLYRKRMLPEVIRRLERIEGLSRIRLSSIEAGDVSRELIRYMSSSKKLCRHLHIPIQSGDDAVLKRMNRKYASRDYLDLIREIKRNVPDISVTTDCLVGFPGETEEEFENTVRLVKEILPLAVHIFPYSSRPGTRAAAFGDTVDPAQIKARCAALKKVSLECRDRFMKRFLGKEVPVLVEGACRDEESYSEGLTDNYLKVNLLSRAGISNTIVRAVLKKASGGTFIGEYIDNI